MFRYTLPNGKRIYKYDPTLEGLREKEREIDRCRTDHLRIDCDNVTLNTVADAWFGTKRGLKDNTAQNYRYMYDQFIRPDFGCSRIRLIKHSDVLRYYNTLIDERGLKPATVDNVHTVLHQIFDLAVQDGYLRNNPSDNALRHLKQARNLDTEKKRALTQEEQDIFLGFLSRNGIYHHW